MTASISMADIFDQAVSHHTAGRLDAAEPLYRAVLELAPSHAVARHNLGTLLLARGQPQEALAHLETAVAAAPGNEVFGQSLAEARKLAETGRRAEALLAQGRENLRLGRWEAAVASFQAVLELLPDHAEAYNRLGLALYSLGRFADAVLCCQAAVEIDPAYADAHNNLGNALRAMRRLEEAAASYRRVLELCPQASEIHGNLGHVLRDLGRPTEAEASYRRSLAIRPDDADILGNLGAALCDLGRFDEGEACYRRALEIQPDLTEVHSNLLIAMAVLPKYDGAAIREQAKVYGDVCRPLFRAHVAGRPHRNIPDPDRPLRVGYLAPNLVRHVLSNDLEPVFRAHHRDQVSVHVYASVPRPDAITWKLKDLVDSWTFVYSLSDDEVANLIENDGIDILVDPMGHWGGNRLSVFARKPAPIQHTYLCQGLTTGLTTMDYVIGDRWLNARGGLQNFATETVVELENGFEVTCVNFDAEIREAPAVAAGVVTFGSFNNPSKLSDRTLGLWGRVMIAHPAGRLLLKGRLLDQPENRARLLDRLERFGIGRDRVDLYGFVPDLDHMDWYNRIDIALDTVPFCGGRTTVEALWMGVPVVSRMGETVVGRYSSSHLSRIGAPELVADTDEAFVRIATDLAGDVGRISRYRHALREMVRTSSLLNAELHVTELEQAYRAMWRKWCAEVTRS